MLTCECSTIGALVLQLVSCQMETAVRNVTFKFAPDTDKPSEIVEQLVS